MVKTAALALRSAFALLTVAMAVPAQNLLVASRYTDNVLEYDSNGKFVRTFATGGGLKNPVGLTFGPDGHLYVGSGDTGKVLKYDGKTGKFLGVFADGGGLVGVRNLNFGPRGNLFVCSGPKNQVLEYEQKTGRFVRVFAQDAALRGPTSMTFGPDGDLYVNGVLSNQVFRFDGATGKYKGVFAQSGLNGPHDLSFGPDGKLYVSNAFGTQSVVQLDGRTGKLLGTFIADIALVFPLGLTWGLDGNLLIANQGNNEVRRYDGRTGKFLGSAVAPGAGGLKGPLFLALVPERNGMSQKPPVPSGVGIDATFPVTGAQPGGFVVTVLGLKSASIQLPCPGQVLRIGDPILFGHSAADESGNSFVRAFVPAALKGFSIRFQSVDVTSCIASTLLVHKF